MAQKKNAIWFHGGGSLIAQEVAIIELLQEQHGLALNQEDTTILGFSTGALMTFAINAAFSDSVAYTWQQFKDLLFNLENSDIYVKNPDALLPLFSTEPLRALLTDLADTTGYRYLQDLPFDSAVLSASKLADSQGQDNFSTYWINNITATEPMGDITDAQQIREHQNQLNLVDILMGSTAISFAFPSQSLRYKDGDGPEKYIEQDDGEPALYCDGGTYGTFAGFEHFCDNQTDTFENLYIICPDFRTKSQNFLGKLWGDLLDKAGVTEAEIELPLDVRKFINDLKAYNDANALAERIFVSTPEIETEGGFQQIDFTRMQEMYDLTMQWGNDPDTVVAVDVYTLD